MIIKIIYCELVNVIIEVDMVDWVEFYEVICDCVWFGFEDIVYYWEKNGGGKVMVVFYGLIIFFLFFLIDVSLFM